MAAHVGGKTDGILRVIREIGRKALSRADADFVVFDPILDGFQLVARNWQADIIDGGVILDVPARSTNRKRTSGLSRWITHPHRQSFAALEQVRALGGVAGRVAGALQNLLMDEKYRRAFVEPGGGRRRLVSRAQALAGPMRLGDNDVLVLCGPDWGAMYDFLQRRQPVDGGCVVVFCHDIIPILYPEFFLKSTAQLFRLCFNEVFRVADLIVFTTETVRRDARSFCVENGFSLPASCVVQLGSSPALVPGASNAALPALLESDRYILMVSTIEPRKGHAMLLRVWKRLIEVPTVREARFRMVFVGRKGWLVDEFLAKLKAEPCFGDSLLLLSNIDDAELAQIYANTAFCVYPSVYEGFGLPVIESFRYGKAVIASNGGALPEVIEGLSPCLDPRDEDHWFRTILSWIEQPELRHSYESAIRSRTSERTWSEMGDAFFAEIQQRLPAKDVN